MKINLINVEFSNNTKSKVVFDTPEIKIVEFAIPKFHEISAHTNPSKVTLYCVKGKGKFLKNNTWIEVQEGDIIIYDNNEPHGMKADEDTIVMAMITPSPTKKLN